MLICPAVLHAEKSPVERWVSRYNGSGNGYSEVHAMTMDTAGNIYVTGASYGCNDSNRATSDYATIKYGPDGSRLWVARYNGPANGYDEARAIAVDASGNVYVTGTSYGANLDYATIKYDHDGRQLWVARYNGPGDDYDGATAIAVDTAGNVYVTGESFDSNTYIDFATIKYDLNGNQLWVTRYNGSRNGNDSAKAIAVDTSGNVYVTGASYSRNDSNGITGDYTTIKYGPAGNQLWAASYNGPGNEGDKPYAMAVDASGNVYVTGESCGSRNINYPLDYATIKYSTTGSQLWVARYDSTGNSMDSGRALAVDSAGNVYVTGSSSGSNKLEDYATVKYDSTGKQLWATRYNNGTLKVSDEACAIAVDTSGNVYVTGFSYDSNNISDYATIKYGSTGNQVWVARYNGPANSDSTPCAIAVDTSGNVYVAGSSYDSNNISDYAMIKYNSSGSRLWVARYNGPGSSYDSASAMAVDALGNVYVTGSSDDSGASDHDYATVKYDPNGSRLWAARYNGTGNGLDQAYAMAVDALGNVYVTGASYDSSNASDYATVKYDPAGNQLWAARYNGPANGYDMAYAVAVDTSGNVYVTGSSNGSGTSSDYATIKYGPAGNQLWVARYNGPANSYDGAYAIAVDTAGNVYVTGSSSDGNNASDYATIKYGPAGNQVWVARYNGPANSYDGAYAIAVDASGNVYVTGASYDSNNVSDYATIKYGSAGNQLWSARYNGPVNKGNWPYAMAVDASGNVYVTGDSVGDGTGWDYATIKYDPAGNQLWTARYNGQGNGYDKVYAMAVDALGNVYVTGESDCNTTGTDYATVKYDRNGNQLWVSRYNGPGNGSDGASAIAVDTSGNVYVTGESKATDGDYATIKYTQHDVCLGAVAGDLNGDCKVDFADFAIFGAEWMKSNYFVDLANFCHHWLDCGFALEEDCQ